MHDLPTVGEGAAADDLQRRLRDVAQRLEVDGPSVVEVPIDCRENMRLTERLGALSGSD